MTFIIGTPHTKNSGYYLNDDRPSGGVKSEADIQTCTHCQCVIKIQGWKEDGGFCGKCMAPICGPCADKMLTGGCVPYMKYIENLMETDYRKSQFRKMTGSEPGVLFNGQS